MSTCSIVGCGKPIGGRGWCKKHYSQWWKYGDPLISKYGKWKPFLEKALSQETDECIPWPFHKNSTNYGLVTIDSQPRLVSRVVCERIYGLPPSLKHQAAHACQNPPCINKRHLRWATPKENRADCLLHGTYLRPMWRGKNLIELGKLDECDIGNIRAEYKKGGVSTRALAKFFNISQSSIAHIINGHLYGVGRCQ